MTTPRRPGGFHPPTRLLVSLLVLALTVGACGSEGSGAPADTSPTTASPPVTNGPPTTTAEMLPYERASGPSAGCQQPDPALAVSTTVGRFEHGGMERAYNLTVPEGGGTEPSPLVVNLHGATGTDDRQDAESRFDDLAVDEGFVLLSPEAKQPLRVWEIAAHKGDVAFVLALIDTIEAGLCIDRGRVYLTGFSMGAMLSSTLSCMQPGRFAAVGAVSGLADVEACRYPGRRRSALIAFQGAADINVLADGSYLDTVTAVSGLHAGPSREELATTWASEAGCDAEPTVTQAPPTTSTVFTCPDGAGVEFHLIAGSDHHWPGRDMGGASVVAPENEPDASRMIWDFFQRQTD